MPASYVLYESYDPKNIYILYVFCMSHRGRPSGSGGINVMEHLLVTLDDVKELNNRTSTDGSSRCDLDERRLATSQ